MNTSAAMIQPDRFEKMEAKKFAGIDRSYAFAAMFGIPGQWMEFGAHYGKVPNQVGRRAYGISHNTRADGLDYMAAVEVSSFDGVPDALARLSSEPHNFAVFKHVGHVSALPATHQAIWTQWVPKESARLVQAPAFEIYMEDFNPLMGTGGIEIWVPVKD